MPFQNSSTNREEDETTRFFQTELTWRRNDAIGERDEYDDGIRRWEREEAESSGPTHSESTRMGMEKGGKCRRNLKINEMRTGGGKVQEYL